MRNHAFVYGLSRTGTTALVDTLNWHPQIAIGMERFKRLWVQERINELGPVLFERERFFDFSDDLTNITPASGPKWQRFYGALAAKWDTAGWVGDKMIQPFFDETLAAFPRGKIVCIVRDPFDTAHSWQQRADNPHDSWPSQRGARKAVGLWHASLRRIQHAALKYPDAVLVVEYGSLFVSTNRDPIERLTRFLQVGAGGLGHAVALARETYQNQLAGKRRDLAEADREFVAAALDQQLWQEVLSLTRVLPSRA